MSIPTCPKCGRRPTIVARGPSGPSVCSACGAYRTPVQEAWDGFLELYDAHELLDESTAEAQRERRVLKLVFNWVGPFNRAPTEGTS